MEHNMLLLVENHTDSRLNTAAINSVSFILEFTFYIY